MKKKFQSINAMLLAAVTAISAAALAGCNRIKIADYPAARTSFIYEKDDSIPFLSAENAPVNPDRGFRGETYVTLGRGEAYPGSGADPYEYLDECLDRFSDDDIRLMQVYVYLIEYCDGELPETERPEYVPPAPTPVYTYVRDLGNRTNRVELYNYNYWRNMYYSTGWQNNPGAFGNCTWYAWYWRRNFMSSEYWLPTGTVGNAGTWTYAAWSNAYVINKTPAYGAVIQTSTGSPGHVGVVVGVNPGVSITIEEMNYGNYPRLNRVFRSTISWSDALTYRYIHAKK